MMSQRSKVAKSLSRWGAEKVFGARCSVFGENPETPNTQYPIRTTFRQKGQTLIIALIVLGILLLIGFIFLGIVSRNIASGGAFQRRTVASDLAEAGVKYAHSQLLNSTDGADWRPALVSAPTANDPDYEYLKGTAAAGGPDNLGAFTRVEFNAGRALVRVRYAPSDANLFQSSPTGALRNPGRARDYLILEAIGRPGKVSLNDPTTLSARSKQEEFKLIAFASIGIIESARFITNKDRVTRAAEIGYPRELGAIYRQIQVSNGYDVGQGVPNSVPLTYQIGSEEPLGARFTGNGNPGREIGLGGSLFSNADIMIHGRVEAFLNSPYGDAWNINGLIQGAVNGESTLIINAESPAPTADWTGTPTIYTLTNTTGLESRSPNFDTRGGLLRDGMVQSDTNGFARGAGRKDPPDPFAIDPNTGKHRWTRLTRDSGYKFNNGVNSGWYGHGRGVYVNNYSDRQLARDEAGRQTGGSSQSLVQDWLNPNNGQPNSGWQGSYYIPRGSFVQFTKDGWSITRDGSAPADKELFWRLPNGQYPTDRSTVRRYKVGRGTDGSLYIVNTDSPFTGGTTINSTLTPADYTAVGELFNGVIYFEGNARVRGVIPTNVQLTLVSGGTIYVEGSITKGIFENDVTGDLGVTNTLATASSSALMLIAREYVTLNTTQFFGPATGQEIEAANVSTNLAAWNPLRMRTGGTLSMNGEALLNPETNANPQLWEPFLSRYASWDLDNDNTNDIPINTNLLVSHTMDDGPAPTSIFSLDVGYGDIGLYGATTNWAYLFDIENDPHNAVNQYLTVPPAFVPLYGLGVDTWQRYPKFESREFPFFTGYNSGTATVPGYSNSNLNLFSQFSPQTFGMNLQETNVFSFRSSSVGNAATNDYMLARLAMLPHDIRIEAAMFAHEGCFFVIPGPWFNPNPNDSRGWFDNRVLQYVNGGSTLPDSITLASQDRKDAYGSFPEMPFYAEPPDIRITIVGAISENMPPPISQQAEWLRKWGWIPRQIGARFDNAGHEVYLPRTHVPDSVEKLGDPGQLYQPNEIVTVSATDPITPYVPNLILKYDPMLATARADGTFGGAIMRQDANGRTLPPMPCLPVSPTLAYFGEVTK